MHTLVLSFISGFLAYSNAQSQSCNISTSCEDCAARTECSWCLTSTSCVSTKYRCHPRWTVMDNYNCPVKDVPVVSEEYLRTTILYSISAVNGINNTKNGNTKAPEQCLSKLGPSASVLHMKEVMCYFDWNKCAYMISLYEREKTIIVGFRTTNSFTQVIFQVADYILLRTVNLLQGEEVLFYYHEVFYKLWTAGLRVDLAEVMQKYPKYRILIVGHSMGGAVSILGSRIISTYYTNVSVVTFSSPRIGNIDFVRNSQHIPTLRVVHNRDWVVDFPFRIQHDRKVPHHNRFEVFFDDWMDPSNTEYRVCSQAEDYTCSIGTWIKWPFAHVRVFKNLSVFFEDGCSG